MQSSEPGLGCCTPPLTENDPVGGLDAWINSSDKAMCYYYIKLCVGGNNCSAYLIAIRPLRIREAILTGGF